MSEWMQTTIEGMSLRDYFAAHAPPEEHWFVPDSSRLVPIPPIPENWKWCEGCKADWDCEGNADCEKLKAAISAQADARAENQFRRFVQWRYAYADAMLKEAQP